MDRLNEEINSPEIIKTTTLELRKDGEEDARVVVHYQWVSWPDKNVPVDGNMAICVRYDTTVST